MRSGKPLIGAFAASALLLHCVGDDPAKDGPATPDSGSSATDGPSSFDAPPSTTDAPVDAPVVGDASPVADAGADATTDAGPSCTIATGGVPGTLDSAFTSGLKRFPGLAPTGIATTYDTETLALDSQGRIYVVGRAQHCVTATSSFDVAVMRLSASGVLDTAFNGGKGYACFDTTAGGSDSVTAAYVDPSDRLVFVGHAGNNEALIGRMLPTGSLDPGFAGAKLLTFPPETVVVGASYTGYGVSQDGNGILVSGGDLHPFGPSTKGWLLRISDAGAVDTASFTPYITSDVAGFRAGHVKLDGKIYLPAKKTSSNEWTMVVVGNNGAVIGTPQAALLPSATAATLPQGVALSTAAGQPDQIFVVGALGTNPSAGAANWWNTSGVAAGPSATLPGFHWDHAYNRTPVARQCDDKTLIAAVTTDTYRPVIARFAARNGMLDTAWGTKGVATIEFDGGPGQQLGGIAIASRRDGRLIVGGQTNGLDGAWVFQLVP